MEDDEQEEDKRVREWVDRLEAFAGALDDIDDDGATDFVDSANLRLSSSCSRT